MIKILKQTALMLLVLLLSLISLTQLSLAAPPDHAMNNKKVQQGHENAFSEQKNVKSCEKQQDPANAFCEQKRVKTRERQQQKAIPPGLNGKGIPPGLLDKGGLPPGMQGRETLPPGIQKRFVDALKDKPEEETCSLVIIGEEYIRIPEEGTATLNYEAVLVNPEANETKITADWSLSDAPEGVSIDAESGVLEVTDSAEPGTVTVQAVYATGEDDEEKILTGSLNVALYKQEAATITIQGKEYVTIQEDDEEPLVLAYTALVKDQHGKIIEGETVNWSVISDCFDGTLIEENLGMIYIIPPKAGSFTIIAKSGEITGTLEVIVYLPDVSSIEIQGKSFVALQEDEDSVSLTYTALVRDQEGIVMEDKEVTWSADDIPGLVLDNGDITLTELPAYGEKTVFTLRAYCIIDNNVVTSGELTVTVYHPVVIEVTVNGAAEITIPAEGEEATAEYVATVADQHGQTIEEEVVWLLTEENGEETEISGAELDNGKLTITSEAAEGSVWLWAIYNEDVYGTFEVQIKQDDPGENV